MSVSTCVPVADPTVRVRAAGLADRLERGAKALATFAGSLSDAEWRMPMPGDGRPVGVIVHHVATVYPLEVQLAQMMARGTPIVGVTWATIAEMNAGHAADHRETPRDATLALLNENSAAAAGVIRAFRDDELDVAVTVSLYGDAELTAQFMLEDHAVRHSWHHLSRLQAAVEASRSAG
ncbi:MAG: DinB family protein [Vicinamibacterales bacterium]